MDSQSSALTIRLWRTGIIFWDYHPGLFFGIITRSYLHVNVIGDVLIHAPPTNLAQKIMHSHLDPKPSVNHRVINTAVLFTSRMEFLLLLLPSSSSSSSWVCPTLGTSPVVWSESLLTPISLIFDGF